MRVGKSVSADQNRIRFVGVSDQGCVEGLKWLDQELIELEPAGDECGCGKWFSLGSSIRWGALMGVEKLCSEIRLQVDRVSGFSLQRVVDAAVQLIDKTPFCALVHNAWIKGPTRCEPRKCLRPCPQRDVVIV